MASSGSKIFEGYKSVGLITSGVPNIIRNIEKLSKVRIVTAASRCFLVYNNHLQLIETCQAHDNDINVISSDSKYIYTASDNEIFAWKYGHRWKSKSFKGCLKQVTHLLPFGPHLLAIDKENILRVWEIRNQELVLSLPFNADSFQMTAILHPPTYLNKVLIGSFKGQLQLWNIRKQSCVFTFDGWGHEVTRLAQAPAIDVVAIGLSNGHIYIHNLKFDQVIMKFNQEWGAVLGLTFRGDGNPHLVSSSPAGHIAIWNLEDKKLESQMRKVHNGPIVGCNFINDEPLLVTNSTDNFLKVWCFDGPDSTGRILYQREGHSAPPTKIRFHGSKGQYILSSGLDSTLRAFSIYSQRLNKSLGFGSFDRKHAKKIGVYRDPRKMPPIIEFTYETTREKEWDDIAACHQNVDIVTTWSFENCRMGNHKLIHQRFRGNPNVKALCVCLSSCGNFVIIGYNTGHIDRFNIQSGIHRCSYGDPKAHPDEVKGVTCDGLNQIVISGGTDKYLRFWRFNKGLLICSVKLSASIKQLNMHRDNLLLAVALTNHYINIIDCETRKLVREFGPHGKEITDMTFNSESRWLITSSKDSIIRVWDLPQAQMIDAFRVKNFCVSLSLSPNGELLATAHDNDVGIYLWSNITLYAHVTLLPLPSDYQVRLLEMPAVKSDKENQLNEEDESYENNKKSHQDNMEIDDHDDETTYKSPDQLNEDLITLSLLPTSRWKNLLHLDLIKKRNKPKEPIKKPEAAPFFLPTIPGLEPKFVIDDKKGKHEDQNKPKLIDKFNPISSFGQLLLDCSKESNYTKIIECLKSMGPSAIDAEIRSLSSEILGSNQLMLSFLDAMIQGLESKLDFELIQSYLGLFLKVHTEVILKDKLLVQKCDQLSKIIDCLWNHLEMDFNRTLCITNYLRSAIL